MGWVHRIQVLFLLSIVLPSAQAFAETSAANYPDRAIKIVSASPAGGGVDLSARIVADFLEKLWHQPTVVEDRPGASSNIAGEAVARSDPDGYTLLATPPSVITANAALFKHLNYAPAALEPVAIMAVAPNVLAVRNDLPIKSVADLIAYAKANPAKMTYASQGNGSTSHLTMELF